MTRPWPYRFRRNKRRHAAMPLPTTVASVAANQARWLRRSRIKRVSWRDEELAGMSLTMSRESDEPSGAAVMPAAAAPTAVTSTTTVEMLDPAIVMRGNVVQPPKFTYSRERLIEISDLPLSKIRPKFLDSPYNDGRGIWALELGHADRKRPETPNEEGGRGDLPLESHVKRRSAGDPRERIRKEQDGIVLSPQRRSFNLGCSAPLVPPVARSGRPESPLGKPDLVHRTEIATRRIGSGRIVTRDVSWDYKTDCIESQEYNFRPGGGPQIVRERRGDVDRDERFERRSFGRDFERDKDRHPTRNGRFGNDRRRAFSDGKDEEPEWFSGGPTSQTDTIELRGFDDIPEERNIINARKKQTATQKKKNKENNNNVNSNNNQLKDQNLPMQRKSQTDIQTTIKEEESPKGPAGRSTPKLEPAHAADPPKSPVTENRNSNESNQAEKADAIVDHLLKDNMNIPINPNRPMESSHEFVYEDFLKMDSIAGLLPNGAESEENSGGSRFSRWFTRESPVRQHDSRRSSLQDEIINNMLKDITEPNISIPAITESNTYFAPISPAAASNGSLSASNSGPIGPPSQSKNSSEKPVTLLEMLQRGGGKHKQLGMDMPLKNMGDVSGKVLSLEELEANIRRGSDKTSGLSQNMTSSMHKPEDDMTAFKRLLAQVSGGHAVPATNGPLPQKQPAPMSLMQMLSKSQQQDENAARNASQHSHTSNHGPQIPPELVMKLHHVQQQQQRQQQQEMMSKLMQANVGAAGRPYQASPIPPDMLNAPPTAGNLELLQRPEAQAIIQGLKRGDITPQHLMQQLANPAIQPRHREMISCVLKLQSVTAPPPPSMHPSPRAVSPGGPHPDLLHQFLFQQQQQLRVSPLPPNAYCVSPILATSPNTLTVHHPAMPQRIPSPRELQAHTQSIMQQALIKKKLEEQRENYRKKQESLQQRSMSPASVVGNISSPAKHLSPTPHSFTPTSVLRKMTATKEPELGTMTTKEKPNSLNLTNNLAPDHTVNKQSSQSQTNLQQNQVPMQGRAVTGMRQPPPSQLPMGWNPQPSGIKQQGRPILKGNSYQQYNSGMDYTGRNMAHMQQPGIAARGSLNSLFAGMQTQHPKTKVNPTVGTIGPLSSGSGSFYQGNIHRPANTNLNNNNVARAHRLQIHMPQMQHAGGNPTLQQLLQIQGQGFENRGIPITGRNSMQFNNRGGSPLADNMPGDLSPTSNQLARWFSPELLAQARAGKLPDMPPVSVAQSARSLEELERIQQAAAAVHN